MERFLPRSSSTREGRSAKKEKGRTVDRLKSLARRTGLFEVSREKSATKHDAFHESALKRKPRRGSLTRGMSESEMLKKLGKPDITRHSFAQIDLTPGDDGSVCSVRSEFLPVTRSASAGASRQLSRRNVFESNTSPNLFQSSAQRKPKMRAERELFFDSDFGSTEPQKDAVDKKVHHSERGDSSESKRSQRRRSSRRSSMGDRPRSSRHTDKREPGSKGHSDKKKRSSRRRKDGEGSLKSKTNRRNSTGSSRVKRRDQRSPPQVKKDAFFSTSPNIPITTPTREKLVIQTLESFPSPFEEDPTSTTPKSIKSRGRAPRRNCAAEAAIISSTQMAPERRRVLRSNSMQLSGNRIQRNAMRERRPSLQGYSNMPVPSSRMKAPREINLCEDSPSQRRPKRSPSISSQGSKSMGTSTTSTSSDRSPIRKTRRTISDTASRSSFSSKGSLSQLGALKQTRRATMSNVIDSDTKSVVSSLSRMRGTFGGARAKRSESDFNDFRW